MTNPDRDELVKLLVWGKSRITGEVGVMAQDAYTSIGHYIASDNGWFLQGQSGWNASASMDAAKAAAQADYEARIRSALVSAPPQSASDGAMREAMLEACDLLAERKQGGYARSPSHNARLVLERALSRDPCGEIKSSDGSVEGHAISGIGSASEQSRQPETPIAGVESGPSEATQPEPEAVTMVRLRSLVMEESSPNMTPDACERQADRIVAAILSRFDVRRR